ncbi:peptidase M48 [Methanobrevibacter sp. 87.7]|uniref:M48 family metallopeptidase n=1 Tax=Methanobrevibacter sp. 87.7 TaxID=387957 RepID=UPI000B5055DC|nr:M48 family metallopeptidase [Methanobrevibacter sp. 87.7]OWT33168.1 peptidase M48 [Methanobrevibacter sp. 87.7]
MKKDDRSAINPFTGKAAFDIINDDKFLEECYIEYNQIINQSKIIDNTPYGQVLRRVANNLINAVTNYLAKIGRLDYIKDYYDWEFHLISSDTVNAFCMPGGKIVMYSGMFQIASTEEEIAFIIGHEMSHALLDHTRTQMSKEKRKNTITAAARLGGLGLRLLGQDELGYSMMELSNVADIGYNSLVLKPFGREQELEADRLGMAIIYWAGYNIHNIPEFWERMSKNNPNTIDFLSTHPSDDKRIATMKELIIETENKTDFYSKPIIGKTNIKIDPKKIEINKEAHIIKRNKCEKCGNICKENDKFCINCGNKLKTEYLCSNCYSEVEVGDKFCINCGKHFKDNNRLCPKCGKPVEDKDKFCINCGNKL